MQFSRYFIGRSSDVGIPCIDQILSIHPPHGLQTIDVIVPGSSCPERLSDFMTKFRHAVNRYPRLKFTLRSHPHLIFGGASVSISSDDKVSQSGCIDHCARLFSQCAVQNTDRRRHFHTQWETIRGRISFFQQLRTRTPKHILAHALHLVIIRGILQSSSLLLRFSTLR
jgi:hypothetical protein